MGKQEWGFTISNIIHKEKICESLVWRRGDNLEKILHSF